MRTFLILFFSMVALQLFSQQTNKQNDQLNSILTQVNQDSITNYMLDLQSFGTRYAYADNGLEIAEWIRDKFQSFGYTDVILDPFEIEGSNGTVTQYNVICKSPNPYNFGDYILVGAHHDSHTFDQPIDSAPGADDNASGTAGVLEIARILKENYNGTIPFHFITFSGEEVGLLGSHKYVDDHYMNDSLPRLYINLDMIANYTETYQMNYYTASEYNGTEQIILENTNIGVVSFDESEARGDNEPFIERNVPTIYFQEYDFSEEYHEESDVMENCEMGFCTEMVQAATAVAYTIGAAYPYIGFDNIYQVGDGTNLAVTWKTAPNCAYYSLHVYHQGGLLQTFQTTSDSILITDLPMNQQVELQLRKTTNDSLKGFVHKKIVQLTNIPEQIDLKSTMNLSNIELNWTQEIPMDIDSIIIQRSSPEEDSWQAVDTITEIDNQFRINNHPYGIYEYSILLIDQEGFHVRSQTTMIYSTPTKDDIMFVLGALGGFSNPYLSDIESFYDSISPNKNSYFYLATRDAKLLNTMQNMELVVWIALSPSSDAFKENRMLISSFLDQGGRLIMFADEPHRVINQELEHNTHIKNTSLAYRLGIKKAIDEDGSRLAELKYNTNEVVELNPQKLQESMHSGLFNMVALEPTDFATPVITGFSGFETFPENALDDLPMAIKVENDSTNTIVCSTPLYYWNTNDVKEMLFFLLSDHMGVYIEANKNSNKHIRIYPNPVQNRLHFERSEIYQSRVELKIYNSRGICTLNRYLPASSTSSIDVSHLPQGLYIVEVAGKETTRIKVLIE